MGGTPRGGPHEPESKKELTLGALIGAAGPMFAADHRLTPHQAKVLARLGLCQTSRLGGHVWICDHCDVRIPMYNSCRDRHCPQCQAGPRFKWVADRTKELLPVPYFHVVFTLPHQLNPWIKQHPKPLLNLLFKAASSTLLDFAKDPKYLGATPGVLMVLHTWGQKLNCHYHVHCIVTGGGLDENQQWKGVKSSKFLFPVKAMSQKFRGAYVAGLKQIAEKEGLEHLKDKFQQLTDDLYQQSWVVYAKKPFGGPEMVLKYLGRYTHRIAISNHRILRFENNQVTFAYKDYRNEDRQRVLTLPLNDFLLRFVAHILPQGLMRIRSYGLLANTRKKEAITRCRELLGEPEITNALELQPERDEATEAALAALTELQQQLFEMGELRVCPECQKLALRPLKNIPKGGEPEIEDSS